MTSSISALLLAAAEAQENLRLAQERFDREDVTALAALEAQP